MKRLIIATLTLALHLTTASAQNKDTALTDTTETVPLIKTTFVFSFDARRSVIRNQKAKIGGIKIGLDFKNKIRAGLGFYGWTGPFEDTIIINEGAPDQDTVLAGIAFNYVSPYLEYIIYQNKKVELSMPIQFGFGDVSVQYKYKNGNTETPIKKSVGVFVISLTGYYKFFTWLGIGGGVGYRNILTKEKIIKKTFNAPVYIVKIRIFFGPIFKKAKETQCFGCFGCFGLF